MYTRIMFGRELKDKLLHNVSAAEIGIWAHTTYLKYIEYIDLDFRDILLTLNGMELGPEFEFSYKMLNKIADDLIAGKHVNLSQSEYREV